MKGILSVMILCQISRVSTRPATPLSHTGAQTTVYGAQQKGVGLCFDQAWSFLLLKLSCVGRNGVDICAVVVVVGEMILLTRAKTFETVLELENAFISILASDLSIFGWSSCLKIVSCWKRRLCFVV